MAASNDTAVDVCILIDATASMGAWIQAAKSMALDTAAEIRERYPGATFRLGVSAYRDFGDAVQYVTIPFTEDINTVRAALESVKAEGGNDDAEDVAGGLHKALGMAWDNNAAKVLIHVTDMPAHGSKYHDVMITDRFPKGFRVITDPRCDDLIAECAVRGIDYYFIRITNNTDKMLGVFAAKYQAAAEAAGRAEDSFFALLDLAIQGQGQKSSGATASTATSTGGGSSGSFTGTTDGDPRPPWIAAAPVHHVATADAAARTLGASMPGATMPAPPMPASSMARAAVEAEMDAAFSAPLAAPVPDALAAFVCEVTPSAPPPPSTAPKSGGGASSASGPAAYNVAEMAECTTSATASLRRAYRSKAATSAAPTPTTATTAASSSSAGGAGASATASAPSAGPIPSALHGAVASLSVEAPSRRVTPAFDSVNSAMRGVMSTAITNSLERKIRSKASTAAAGGSGCSPLVGGETGGAAATSS